MFGAIVPNHTSIITNFQKVSDTRFALAIPHGNTPIQSLVVCLQPNQQIPQNYGCSIYLSDNGQNWEYMGCLLNNRPSALVNPPLSYDTQQQQSQFGSFQQQQQNTLYVGISLESLDTLKNLEQDQIRNEQREANQIVSLAKYLAQNLFNYMTSYIRTFENREMIVLPTNALDTWMKKIMTRLQNDPYFWKNAQ
jgi:hypothetical protein